MQAMIAEDMKELSESLVKSFTTSNVTKEYEPAACQPEFVNLSAVQTPTELCCFLL